MPHLRFFNFAGIRNDLKDIMGKIEEQLHLLHAATKNDGPGVTENEPVYGAPIIKISSVAPNSPADEAVSFSRSLYYF